MAGGKSAREVEAAALQVERRTWCDRRKVCTRGGGSGVAGRTEDVVRTEGSMRARWRRRGYRPAEGEGLVGVRQPEWRERESGENRE